MTAPAKTCGCCGKAKAPTQVKSYLNKQMCVECVRGFVRTFAQDPDYNHARQEEILEAGDDEKAEVRRYPVEPGDGIVDNDYDPRNI